MIEANDTKERPAPPDEGERGPTSPHERTCVGCGERSAPAEMVRLVIGPSGDVAVDAAGGGFGRGAHVHARKACLAQAAKGGLLRATKGKARTVSVVVKEGGAVLTSEAQPIDAVALASAIEAAMGRRIEGLLFTSARTRKARIGADAVTSAWRGGEAALIVVATDAAAGAGLTAVREAVAAGAAVAWGTKERLGKALGRDRKPESEGVAVVAITDARLAGAVRDAVEKATGCVAPAASARERTPRREVTATKPHFRSKVGAERAGRFERRTRRAQGKQAVERSE